MFFDDKIVKKRTERRLERNIRTEQSTMLKISYLELMTCKHLFLARAAARPARPRLWPNPDRGRSGPRPSAPAQVRPEQRAYRERRKSKFRYPPLSLLHILVIEANKDA